MSHVEVDFLILFLLPLQLLSTHSLNSQAHMNIGSHLTVGSHLSGLAVTARGSETSSTADNPVPSSTATRTSASIASQPSIHSLTVNVDMYLANQSSGVCYSLYLVCNLGSSG